MLQDGFNIYIRHGDAADGTNLVSGSILTAEDGRFDAFFEGVRVELPVDQRIFVFYHVHWKFRRREAIVRRVLPKESGTHLVLEPVGEEASAEQRDTYRVATLTSDIGGRLEGVELIEIVNVSASGLAVVAEQSLALEQECDAELCYGGATHAGRVRIRCRRKLHGDRVRYGLEALGDDRPGSLRAGLRAVSLEVEREILRSLSGA